MYYFRSEPYLIGETHSNEVNVGKRYWEHENRDGTNKWIREDILRKYYTTSDTYLFVKAEPEDQLSRFYSRY